MSNEIPESNSPELDIEFAQLIELVRKGNLQAAETLVEKYSRDVQRFVRRSLHHKLRSKFDSIDFVQVVWASFFRCPEKLHDMVKSEQLIAYLATLAKFKVLAEVRRRLQTEKHNVDREELTGGDGPSREMMGNTPTPSAVAIAKERWDQLLANETDQVRRIVELRLQGTTYTEIATQLSIHERTARKTIKRLLSQAA
ncbi:RNA polymerase sigma factor [Anatilimnocola floriformis]|uniref:RNA polymerase sigma factor n=1 Tax=Anatilimnocola floriformis TaxID=2948575 RepID=UPI0020C2997E|nr:sigma-70 family RNA polymerase sigma factor [Anatilimnocola floriformis]